MSHILFIRMSTRDALDLMSHMRCPVMHLIIRVLHVRQNNMMMTQTDGQPCLFYSLFGLNEINALACFTILNRNS